MAGEQRGKDLRWTPQWVKRDVQLLLSEFRSVSAKVNNLDDEHGEREADEAKLLAKRIDAEVLKLIELVSKVHEKQTAKRKEEGEGA